jgi:hypothetical protein
MDEADRANVNVMVPLRRQHREMPRCEAANEKSAFDSFD